MAFFKLVVMSTTAAITSSPFFDLLSMYVQQPVWGVPVTIFGASAFGAGLSFFFSDPVRPRRALFGQVLAATFFGAGLAVLVADAMDWDWAQKNMGMFALISGAMIRWWLPSVIDRGKAIIRDFKISFIKSGNGEGK